MNERIMALRHRLTGVRDEAVRFITQIDNLTPPEWKAYNESRPWGTRSIAPDDTWPRLSTQAQDSADQLRASVRQVMAEIAQEAQRSVLVDVADLRSLGQNAKTMAASLRFRRFRHWEAHIHHDEGTYLGMNPPGQSEDELILPEAARSEFLEAYRKTIELMDYMAARRDSFNPGFGASLSNLPPVQSYRPGTAFIMMAIDPSKPDLQDVRDVVKETFGEFGINAIRADEIEHSDGITDRIIEEIRQSQYLFADLTGERPSVYYEIGFAHAIGKTVLLYRKKGTTIHFDLAYRNSPEYENLADLRNKLRNRLTAMTGQNSRLGNYIQRE
jgi:hypothetical protein